MITLASSAPMAALGARLTPYAVVPGRVLLGGLFVMSGIDKVGKYAATQGYMEAFGLPGALLPVVIAFELAAGLALVAGLRARMAALLLAGFVLAAAAVFHTDFADQIQAFMFLKNAAIAGGLLTLVASGPGPLSLDQRG
jgi:putative oxidoreductase